MDAWDPTGEKAPAVKARYVGVCRGCGAYPQPHNGKGTLTRTARGCHPGAIARRWIPGLVLEAMLEWQLRCGDRRPRMTGRGRTAGAGERRCGA